MAIHFFNIIHIFFFVLSTGKKMDSSQNINISTLAGNVLFCLQRAALRLNQEISTNWSPEFRQIKYQFFKLSNGDIITTL